MGAAGIQVTRAWASVLVRCSNPERLKTYRFSLRDRQRHGDAPGFGIGEAPVEGLGCMRPGERASALGAGRTADSHPCGRGAHRPVFGQFATKRQVQNMFWARACHKAVAVTASRPRTRNRVRPWLRAWALAHSTVEARSL